MLAVRPKSVVAIEPTAGRHISCECCCCCWRQYCRTNFNIRARISAKPASTHFCRINRVTVRRRWSSKYRLARDPRTRRHKSSGSLNAPRHRSLPTGRQARRITLVRRTKECGRLANRPNGRPKQYCKHNTIMAERNLTLLRKLAALLLCPSDKRTDIRTYVRSVCTNRKSSVCARTRRIYARVHNNSAHALLMDGTHTRTHTCPFRQAAISDH